jgi:hypothetical protein
LVVSKNNSIKGKQIIRLILVQLFPKLKNSCKERLSPYWFHPRNMSFICLDLSSLITLHTQLNSMAFCIFFIIAIQISLHSQYFADCLFFLIFTDLANELTRFNFLLLFASTIHVVVNPNFLPLAGKG